jgi:hypothetical protein
MGKGKARTHTSPAPMGNEPGWFSTEPIDLGDSNRVLESSGLAYYEQGPLRDLPPI